MTSSSSRLQQLSSSPFPSSKPNIVFIYVDNHPGAVAGYAGNPEIHTPNLDQLAKEGTNLKMNFMIWKKIRVNATILYPTPK